MKLVLDYLCGLARDVAGAWNRFWFTPADPATLCLIRILAGALLLYTHAIWTLDLDAFFGQQSWVSAEAAKELGARDANGELLRSYSWSYFWLIKSPGLLWTVHFAALGVFAALMLGLFSRVAALAAFLAAVSYVNRTPGTQFGLDPVQCMLAMYLWIGPCGGEWSLDRLWRARRWKRRTGSFLPPAAPSVGANIAIRLLQLHLCVIYFFAAIGKLSGAYWWNGQALWFALANRDNHQFDVEWFAAWPVLGAVLTAITVYWELSFPALIWVPRLRPLMLAIAVVLHLGIGFGMGLVTFGLAMLIACTSFVSPWLVRRIMPGAG